MSDEMPPTAPKPEQPSTAPAAREPWTPPALESLDVKQTMVMVGTGTDGGPALTNLS